ncbi:hypothetical protein ACH79_31780 [Bradyrhizobium sp. CCBAU 051011]|uniref:hypothetical protein n=1 Tax=Bradyrhizobium sp. CCBAU 051011 TaxID=858422 RepID=UPI001373B917|nr:hypothetical protein [Bradyrhizobium sp. CCBAU 051011]QHO76521.1 hypothetical protein ACH79_31780 [Bradyrhizobium sp. CCBAU 051011]
MLFSERFRITKSKEDVWFDPILFADTKLFIDPFLIFDNEGTEEFKGSHAEVVQFFDFVFKLIAQSKGQTSSPHWKQAVTLLELGEVHELCIGYSGSGTQGAGSGRGLATQMARGLYAAVQQGVTRLEHFEEVQIFEERIGADRISDATAGILRNRLAKYTEAIAKKYELPTQEIRYLRAFFDITRGRWQAARYELPLNPYSEHPVLLVPEDYLRALPTINPSDFWDYCFDTQNETIRREFGNDITRNVDKATIIDLARRHPELREKYVKAKETEGSEPYNLNTDPHGYYQPYLVARGWAGKNIVHCLIASSDDLFRSILQFTNQYKNYVENNEGWRLLWNDDKSPKREIAFQALFSGVIIPFCQANNIDISKEANIGRGPVDFKFSQGYSSRVLLEAKLASNSKFWSGLTKQLPMYLKAEQIDKGIFLVACQREADFKRIPGISTIAAEVSAGANVQIEVIAVDCLYGPPSASKL